MSGHSDFSPSGRHRWRACPGSVNLIRALDLPDLDTPYSLEGTLAHSIAADALVHDKNPTDLDIAVYVDYVRSLPGAKMIEAQLIYPSAHVIHGTPDAVAYDFGGVLEVVDFKYGEGFEVQAEGNPQLEMYAVLAAAVLDAEVNEVRLTIVQPRTGGEAIRTAVYPGNVLPEWDHVIGEEVFACYDTQAPLVSGQHCQWCKAKAHCPELLDHTNIAAAHESRLIEPARLHPDQLAWLLEHRKRIRTYLDAVEEYAMQQALAGKLPGYKAVGTLKNREWGDEKAARKLFRGLKLKLDQYAPRKLLSPAQAEKVVGKGMIDACVKREPGSPKLVRDDAPGEAINVLEGFTVVNREE